MPKPKKVQETKKTFRVGYVALIGRPNVGKSTLLNRLLGQKIAIVSSKPQTTRISILGIHTTDKGQIIFIDNPGIHKPLHNLNKRMMDFVYSSLETANLICLLIDATEKFGHGDEFVLEILKNVRTPIFLLINKVDIVKKENILLMIDKYKDLLNFKEIIPISAVRGINLDVLEKLIYESLPESEKIYSDDEISDQSERFLLAEIIREKVLNHVEKELPWVTAVYIDAIERRGPQAAEAQGERAQPIDSGERSKTFPEAGEKNGWGPTSRENGRAKTGRIGEKASRHLYQGYDLCRKGQPPHHHHRQAGAAHQDHRDRGAPGDRRDPGIQGLPGPSRQSPGKLARLRRCLGFDRRPEIIPSIMARLSSLRQFIPVLICRGGPILDPRFKRR